MRYCKVLQRGCPEVYRCAIKVPRVTRTGTQGKCRAPQSGCIGLHLTRSDYTYLVQHTQHCHRSTMGKITVKHATSEKAGTTDYTAATSKVCIGSQTPHCRTVFQNGKTKPQKHLPMSNQSWNTRQDFLKIPSLREAALETERRCFSKVNLESNVTPNISRSPDFFSTVPSMLDPEPCWYLGERRS